MLDQEKGIDAVVIATPDHTHAVIAMAAMQAGQARLLPEAADPHHLRGSEGHRSGSPVQGRDADGQPGALLRGDPAAQGVVWTTAPSATSPRSTRGPTGPWAATRGRTFAVQAKPSDTPPVPETLDWDLWLGPVPYRPYHPDYHPLKWRAWLDFGTGALGDMGCHIIDPAFWALELGAPRRSKRPRLIGSRRWPLRRFPRASIVRFAFPARGNRPPVKLTWYDGRLLPPIPEELEPGRQLPSSGALLIGDKGKIVHGSHGADGLRLIPESRMKEYKRPAKTLRRVTEGHEGDWIRACKEGPGGTPPCSTFEYGGALTEMALLGMLAIRMKDQRLEWDSQNLRFTNNEKANELLHIKYRDGWTL